MISITVCFRRGSTDGSRLRRSFFQPDAVHCWLFARSTFPREFRIYPGSQCGDQVPVTSSAGRPGATPVATFVKKRVRSPRLFAAAAADRSVTPASPKPEIRAGLSGRPRDGRRRQSATEPLPSDDTSTHHSERHISTTITHSDDDISTFSLLAAAVILAVIQCAFLCAH